MSGLPKSVAAQPVVSLRREVDWSQFQQHLTATYIQRTSIILILALGFQFHD